MLKKKDSFFRNDVKNTVWTYFSIYTILFLVMFLPFFIMGIYGFVNNTGYGFVIFFSIMPIAMYPIFAWYMPTPIYYNRIRKLLEKENEAELQRIANKSNNRNRGGIVLCALFDLNPEIVRPILNMYHTKTIDSRYNMKFIENLTKVVLKWESQKLIDTTKESKPKTTVKITKAYFIKEKSELGKGMITKTQLTMDYEIVICPYCSNMARKELLAEWLSKNKTCPICSTEITIDDCPVVDIRDH